MVLVIATLSGLISVNSTSAQLGQIQPTPTDTPEMAETLDDRFAEVATEFRGFGGMFLDETTDTLYIYLMNPSQTAGRPVEARLKATLGRERLQKKNVRLLRALFTFQELKQWHDRMSGSVLSLPGVVFTDIDEGKNRLTIGLEEIGKQSAIERVLARLNVPREAIDFEEAEPVEFASSLRDYHRPVVDGLQINKSSGSEGSCTLGFLATRAAMRGFVTNSHCTGAPFSPDGAIIGQPSMSTASNRIGVESIDRTGFTGGACPSGSRCRYSDSAFVTLDSGVSAAQGRVARPAVDGSVAWNGVDFYRIVGEVDWPILGEIVTKVGRTSGRTSGAVNRTCLNGRLGNTNLVLLCQDEARYRVAYIGGDSGSPVFKVTNPQANQVVLYGITWGKMRDQPPCAVCLWHGVFSAIGPLNVKRNSELGAFVTADPSICPACGPWDHYYVWRGGTQAINKAVWWAANRFVARYPRIRRIKFNSGGGASGWADSAVVKIFRNESMTDLVAELFVPNVVDYAETIADFPSPVPLTPGQTYWWQIHTGDPSRKILLYFSTLGLDYSEGCAYWRNDFTYSDCTFDLNGVVQQYP